MKVIRNRSEDMVTEMIEGYVKSNLKLLKKLDGTKAVLVRDTKEKVMVLAGGGAGCEPLYLGCVGEGMADAVVSGNIFAAPPATALLKTIKNMYHEKGILMVTGNYIGDVLNYELAVELCEYEGIQAKTVFVKDDILHASKDNRDKRRGIGGILHIIKIAAAASNQGLELEEVARIANKATDFLGTVSVTFWSGYRPETGKSMFEMPEAQIEFGMGFNGEPGVMRMDMPEADKLAEIILEYIVKDLQIVKGDEILLVVNGKGATSNMELYVLVNSLHSYLNNKKICIFKTETGNFFTAPGMGGVSITVMKLDKELKKYCNQDAYTPMYTFNSNY